jgi:uncharacterized glyoxalase superfamily protein PhnB
MTRPVKAVPEGHHTVTPHLIVRGGDQAIAFYKKAFGAEEVNRAPGPDGKKLMHAVIKIGDSLIHLSDEFPDMGSRSPQTLGGTAAGLLVYVEDVDAAFQRAVAAGAQVGFPVADMFWGDRFGKVVDPFGHEWALATHKEDVSHEEAMKRAAAHFAQMGKKPS